MTSPLAAATPTRAEFDRTVMVMKAALMREPAATLRRLDDVARIARSLGAGRDRVEAIATVERLRGEGYVQIGRIDKAEPLLKSALSLVRQEAPGAKVEAELLMSLGGVHADRGEPAAAFAEYRFAYDIFQRLGDNRNEALVLMCISSLYGDANDFAAALKYLDQAIALRLSDPNLLMSIYNNRATNLQELGRYPEAELGYRKALGLSRQVNSTLLQARILGNIARVRLKMGDVAGAQGLIGEALAITDRDDAAPARLALSGLEAQASYQARDYHRAATLIARRFAGVDLATTTISSREAHQTAYDIYRTLGDAPRAMAHLAALKRLDDQATRLATTATTALAAARFDFTNQELRLANQRAQYERQQAHTQWLIFLGLAAGTAIIIVLLAVWLITLVRSRNKVRAAADDLAVTNAALGKALAAKTEFLATTSHEIRTPLNGILGMTQVMLADPLLAADTRDRIGVVHGAGVTMRALVDDILDVAKMETGNLTVEHVAFDLAATLADATRLWAEQARSKGIGFVVDLAECPIWIEGDAARVRQIAFNLLSNALKFTNRGEVVLRVDQDADHYRIVVADTGIGIAADKIEDIFESFKQADAGTMRQFGGTGLGLAICRNLARAMGGDVTVASVPGEGSVFTARLPLVAAQAADDAGDDGRIACGGVLIVDASPIGRAMLKTLVGMRCSDVVAAASLEEGIAHAGAVDLILIDQSAIGSVAALDAFARDAGSVPTVLWRGDVPDDIADAARVIAKPIAGPALLGTLFDTPAHSSLVRRAA